MYIFTLNFNSRNIPANLGGGRLGWVSLNGHLQARRTVGLSQPGPLHSPGWGRREEAGSRGRRGAVLQRKNWAGGGASCPSAVPCAQ